MQKRQMFRAKDDLRYPLAYHTNILHHKKGFLQSAHFWPHVNWPEYQTIVFYENCVAPSIMLELSLHG